MKPAGVAVDSNAQRLDAASPPEAGGPAGARFTYASGSRPLEGYTIKRGVGHGGFGEVYFAVSDAGKEVALKLIRRNLDVELRGIRHCLNLKHPDLLSVFDLRTDDRGDNWVVMEYVTGDCLEAVLAAHPQGMPVDDALAWLHGIGAGVGYLHDHGIVHRDLKPGNIFSDEGIVKIGDYGLSKFISCSRRSGQTESIGTIHYMAPEIANGRYGKEIDIYALGVILYEMLTGHLPFEGESVGEILMKHLTAEPDLSRLAEPFRSAVGRALAKDPEKRFASVGEFLAALPKPAQSQVSTAPLPPTAGPRPQAAGKPAPVVATVVDEEPILRTLRQWWGQLVAVFQGNTLNTPTKIVLIIGGLYVLFLTMGIWLPATPLLLIGYGGYLVVRMLLRSGSSPAPKPTPPVGSPRGAASPAAREPWNRRQEPTVPALLARSPQQRLAELLGSMVGGAVVALIVCLVMVMLSSFRSKFPLPEQFAWLAVMSVLGTWAVMIPSKLWEGIEGEAILRRFVLLVIGLALGVVGALMASYLDVTLPYDSRFTEIHSLELPSAFYRAGQPQWMAFVACFGTLFFLVRWWRQTDPLRRTRLRIGPTAVTIAAAWLVAALWLFPHPWLMLLAGTMSVSVQLASPWLPPRLRQAEPRRR